jgi:hypothetical protein
MVHSGRPWTIVGELGKLNEASAQYRRAVGFGQSNGCGFDAIRRTGSEERSGKFGERERRWRSGHFVNMDMEIYPISILAKFSRVDFAVG